MSASPTPADFLLAKDNEQEDAQMKRQAENAGAELVSAADYDPSLDRREDEQKRFGRGEEERKTTAEPEIIEDDEDEEEDEDDVDDMFAVAMSDTNKVKKVKKRTVTVSCSPSLYFLVLILLPYRNRLPLH